MLWLWPRSPRIYAWGVVTQLLADEVGEVDPRLLEMNEQFVRHPSNIALAKMVVYTNGKTPEQTCNEIVPKLIL